MSTSTRAIVNRCYDYEDLKNKLDLLIDQLNSVKLAIKNCTNKYLLDVLNTRKNELQTIVSEIIVKYL